VINFGFSTLKGDMTGLATFSTRTVVHIILIRRAGTSKYLELEMWADDQRDGRPAERRWRPLFNAAKFG